MTKVFFLVTKDDVGGAQKYVKDLAEHLDRQKFQIKILTGGQKGARFLSNALRPHFLFINDIAALVELFLILRREKPDIVHLNSSKAGVIGAIAAKLAGVPKVVFTAHGWVFNPDNELGFLRRRFYILLHKLAALFQDHIVNVSEYDRQLAIRHSIAPSSKLRTIHNGIASISFLSKKEARRTLNNKLKADDEIWIGTIGRLVVEKDYETLIEAAALVPRARFFIIGSGPKLRNLKLKIQNLKSDDRVHIIENIAPAAPYLKAFDIFALSSIKEGLPYTMLEAMMAEVPVVTTRIGGMTEIIDGRGLVMPPRQSEELARALNYLLDNPDQAKNFVIEAKKFLENNLMIDKMVRETEKIYLQCG